MSLKTVMTLALVVIASYLFVSAAAYAFQRQLIYFPARERVLPADVGLVNVDEVTLRSAAGDAFHSWFGRARDGQPTVLFFHGNAGAVSHRDYRFQTFMEQGYGLFILGYPGYGGGDGAPSEASFVEAAAIAYAFLRDEGIGTDDIVIYGESIGSGVAVQLAADVAARALVLEAPMASAVDVASTHYPYLPVSLLMKDRYMSVERVAEIDMPLLVMHGERDSIIPIASGKQLFERALEPKTFVPLEGGGHNDLFRFPTLAILGEFLDAL